MYSIMVVFRVLSMKFLHRLMKCDKFSLDFGKSLQVTFLYFSLKIHLFYINIR